MNPAPVASAPGPSVRLAVMTGDAARAASTGEALAAVAEVRCSGSLDGLVEARWVPDVVLVDGALLGAEGLRLYADVRRRLPDAVVAVLASEGDALTIGERVGMSGRLPFVTPGDDAALRHAVAKLMRPRQTLRREVKGVARVVTALGPRTLELLDVGPSGIALFAPGSERLAGLLPLSTLEHLELEAPGGEPLLRAPHAVVRHLSPLTSGGRAGFRIGVELGAHEEQSVVAPYQQRLVLFRRAIAAGARFRGRAPGEDDSAFELGTPSLLRVRDGVRLSFAAAAPPGFAAGDPLEVAFDLEGATWHFVSSIRRDAPVELAFPRRLIENLRRRHARLPSEGDDQLRARVFSPLHGAWPEKAVVDLHADGLSVSIDPTTELVPPGLELSAVEIWDGDALAYRSRGVVARVTPQPQTDAGPPRARAGIALRGGSERERERLNELILRRRWDRVSFGRASDRPAIWAFLRDAGLTFHEYLEAPAPAAERAQAMHARALGDGLSPLYRSALVRDTERIYAHCSALKVFPRAWLNYQVAAVRGTSEPRANARSVLLALGQFIQDRRETEYLVGYWRTDNRFSSGIFGRTSAQLGNGPATELRQEWYCRRDLAAAPAPSPAPASLTVRPFAEGDRPVLEAAYAARGQHVRLRAEGLVDADVGLAALNAEYAREGLERYREILVAEDDGRVTAFAVLQHASPGLCLSELTNAFHVVVLEPGAGGARARRSLLDAAAERYRARGLGAALCLSDEVAHLDEYRAAGYRPLCEVAVVTVHRSRVGDFFRLIDEFLSPARVATGELAAAGQESAPAPEEEEENTLGARYVLGRSEGETRRLVRQAQAMDLPAVLAAAGLRRGMSALDVGCGPGITTSAISRTVGPAGRVQGIDLSPERIESARSACPEAQFQVGDALSLPFEEGQFDFTYSQYMFEYLPDPDAALREMIRVTRRGGTVAVADIDGLMLSDHPMAPALRERIDRLMEVVGRGGFDPWAGRKLFSRFAAAGLCRLEVQLRIGYIVPGAAGTTEVEGWRQRFAALSGPGVAALGSPAAWRTFVDDYLAHLRDPGALKLAPMIVVSGLRP